ncbi:RNA-binding protein [Hyalangium minutum]|uniref:RNA-binding protein n=1 Tax=Hyalangium minutum TaxID=394096 RepID=UPI0004E71F29|nr:RNA-binding protein [Hyalangium minutum]
MTEQAQPQQSPSGAGTGGETRGRVEKLLPDILGLMGYPARLEFRDASDGSLAVALHFEAGLPPGVESGKRSQVLDSLQFLLNKMLHRPGFERRWVLLGAGVFPEPRPRKEAPPLAPAPGASGAAPAPRPAAPPKAQAPAPAPAPAPQQKAARPAPAPAAPPPAKRGEPDERTVEAPEDAVLKEAARQLAGKSGSLGRFYAIAAMKLEDRARVLKAVEGVAGVAVTGEGEGRCRRVVFTPEKPAPLPRKMLLPDDDEDDFEG